MEQLEISTYNISMHQRYECVEDVAEQINVQYVGDSSAIVGFKGVVTFVLQFVLSAESVKG